MNTRTKILIISTIAVLACCLSAPGDTPEDLLALHAAQLAAMNAHDLDKMMSYWADDGVYDLVSQPPPTDKAGVRAGFQMRFAAYPDLRMVMVRVLATDKIVVGAMLSIAITLSVLWAYGFLPWRGILH